MLIIGYYTRHVIGVVVCGTYAVDRVLRLPQKNYSSKVFYLFIQGSTNSDPCTINTNLGSINKKVGWINFLQVVRPYSNFFAFVKITNVFKSEEIFLHYIVKPPLNSVTPHSRWQMIEPWEMLDPQLVGGLAGDIPPQGGRPTFVSFEAPHQIFF